MAKITFFEKVGCVNGGKQKAILTEAGHELTSIDLIIHQWTRDELLPFIQEKKPTEIMNYTAPAIKKGEVKPENLTFDQAVDLMIKEPILIKRPLIKVDGLFIQGFTNENLKPYLGDWDNSEDVTTCPKLQTVSCDESKPK